MIKSPVVAKKGNKWWIGFLNGYKIEPIEEIQKLSDVKNRTDYKGLITFIRTKGFDRKEADKIMKKTGYDSIYILNKPIGLNEKQFEEFWWMDRFNKCKTCINDCKQSHMIKELKCKQFKRGQSGNKKDKKKEIYMLCIQME